MNQDDQKFENERHINSKDYYSKIQTGQNHRPKIIGPVLIIVFLISISYLGYSRWQRDKSLTDNSVNNVPIIEKPITATPENPASTPSTIPSSGILEVPFTTQAPLVNWDALHEEACEEASLIMLKHYKKNTSIDSPESADQEIINLVNWESNNGFNVDVTLQQISDIAKKYYGMNSGRIITDVTIDNIKKEISAGHPVIIPAAGKILPNPNFRNGGPNYHMLVIIGYDQEDFITNDPGTRNGKNFRYKYNDLINAIHDWDSNNILEGRKAMLVFD